MRRFVPLTALVLLVAGGCGDDDETPSRTVTADFGETVRVVADEYSFDPDTIVLSGGPKITIELDNEGSLAHNLRVFDGAKDLGGTPTFVGGEPRAGTIGVEPGEYEILCTVGDHAELGMTGKLVVK